MVNKENLIIRLIILLFLVGLIAPATLTARIIYVDDDATGANVGSSWVDAYKCLQDALGTAQYGDEIRVVQGIYKPDQGANQIPGDREATFQLISGITLAGGYAGPGVLDVNEAPIDPNTRHIDLFKTILSGDLNGDDAEALGPGNLSTDPNRVENCFHVVTGSRTNADAVLDGFVITAGVANRDPTPWRRGGGVYNDYGSPTFRNCTFLRNIANDGGAVSNWDSSPVFMNCLFTGNEVVPMTFTRGEAAPFTDASFGGGVYNLGLSNPVFINCAFWRNSAQYGGAIHTWDDSSPTLYNCTLSGNMADFGGAIYNYSINSPATTTTINNSIIWGNYTENYAEICTGGKSTTIVTYSCIAGGSAGTGNTSADPRFVSGPLGGYYLSQRSAGQTLNSPCVDAGSDTATNLGMNELTTRTDEVFDQGIVDMGYHYPKSPPRDLIIARNVEGFETGDFSKFNWIFSGDENWTVTSTEKNSGTYSAQAGSIGNDQYTTLQITLDCVSGDISFYLKVSSESGYDYLKFYINDVEKGEWSGECDWVQVSFSVTAGTRTFKWVYEKDSSASRGSDTAWIDYIVFPIH